MNAPERFSNSELMNIAFILNAASDQKIQQLAINPLSANPTKWSNTLKQFVGKFPTNCLSVFDHFVKLALKGLSSEMYYNYNKSRINPWCLEGSTPPHKNSPHLCDLPPIR